jgi:leucyl aminopeptidase
MSEVNLPADHAPSTPIRLVGAADWANAQPGLTPAAQAAAATARFAGKSGETLVLRSGDGTPELVFSGLGDGTASPSTFRALAARLPAGDYHIETQVAADAAEIAVAWAQGTYRFDRYKHDRGEAAPRLVTPAGADLERVHAIAHACALARDMVNTPANDMGPLQIETIAREIAALHDAEIAVVSGDALLDQGYPAVHAVGRAAVAERAPRMVEITWGDPDAPVVVVVGKGVVFDTGGLDIKLSGSMRLMKKDMGGAAHALALGRMIMGVALPVRLVVLLPVVENAIAGDAMRPGDVLASRKGLSIEVGNTDAEGRLILADALTRASELSPVLTVDMATLTGAARVALGPQVIPFYTDDDELAAEIAEAAHAVEDPLWRMPLWRGYAPALDSDIADLKNDPDGWAQAGSMTAALFLQRFAPAGSWVHFDIFAWNPKSRPGWPVGAEAQAIRALFRMLERRFCSS